MVGAAEKAISAVSLLVFAFLDLLEWALCIFYRYLDSVFEEKSIPCYCRSRGEDEERRDAVNNGGEGGISETLFGRRNLFRDMGLFATREAGDGLEENTCAWKSPRWSDCGCGTCVSWQRWQEKGQETLHLVHREPIIATGQDNSRAPIENVIFLHGFLSSSLLWVETVFPNISEEASLRTRMFAVDLLGFGNSAKPADCLYTIEDHLVMIERTVIRQFSLDSFHIVAHSMGCILALALAAKRPKSVKSITLVAPIYFPSVEDKDKASHNALNRLAGRKIWPPLLFGSAVMSWYEHIGRTICFLYCSNHHTWERIMKLITWKRDLPHIVTDITKHTHHSAWHTMHNVICGGAKFLDKYLEILQEEGILLKIIQGTKDQVVPVECSFNMNAVVPKADLQIIKDADHASVILGRKQDFTKYLEETWLSA